MGTKEIAFHILGIAQEQSKNAGDIPLKTYDFITQFPSYSENELSLAFEYLNEKDYIETESVKGVKLPLIIKLKSAGHDWINDDQATANSVDQIFNFQDNYEENTNLVIDNTCADFGQLAELIRKNTINDSDNQRELEKIKSLLQEFIVQEKPLSKGLLKRFSQAIQENSWIAGPLSAILLKYLAS